MNNLKQKDKQIFLELNQTFLTQFPKDAARKIETMPAAQAAHLLEPYPGHVLEPLWHYLMPGISDELLLHLSKAQIRDMLMAMDPILGAAILSRLKNDDKEKLLTPLDKAYADELRELASYPQNTAGRLMESDIAAFHQTISVDEAIKQVRARKDANFRRLYLLDDDLKLSGHVDVQKLVMAEGDQTLSSLAMPIKVFVYATDSKEELIEKIEQYKVDTIPVLNINNNLLGLVHSGRLFNAVKEDVLSDMQSMVGASKDERALSSAFFAVRKRLPWLSVNLLTAFLAAAVVGAFESTIAKFTALAVLLPVAAGQSGNTGAQALAVTMRGLTLREVTTRHWLKVAFKELGAGFINGVAIAVLCAIGVYIWNQNVGLSLVIALSMVASMTIAGVSGALVPMALRKLGQDPAQSSSIILTTVTDIAGFLSFLGIATALAGMLE